MSNNLFRKIDDYFFDDFPGFQKIQDWTQENFGLDCFSSAKIVIILQSIAVYFKQGAINSTFVFIISFVILLGVLKKQNKNFMNPERQRGLIERYLIIIMCAYILFWRAENWLDCAHVITVFSFWYLMACTQKPPSESKFKKFLKGLSGGRLYTQS